MVAIAYTVAFEGVEARLVEVQCAIAPGLPAFAIVGLPDKAVSEARERVKAAFGAMAVAMPSKRITVNLSPADLPKEGSHFDLPIALAVLAACEIIPAEELEGVVSLGELALDGRLVAVGGALPAAMAAGEDGRALICPRACGAEAAWVGAVPVFAPAHLREAVAHLTGRAPLSPAVAGEVAVEAADSGAEGRGPLVEAADESGVDFAGGVDGLAPGRAGVALARGEHRQRRVHLDELFGVEPGAGETAEDGAHRLGTGFGEQQRDLDRGAAAVVELSEEGEDGRLRRVGDEDRGLQWARIERFHGHRLRVGEDPFGVEGRTVLERRVGGVDLGLRGRGGLAGLCGFVGVGFAGPDGLGPHLVGAPRLAGTHRCGAELGEHGVDDSIVDPAAAEEHVLCGADEVWSQGEALSAAQGEGDAESAHTRAFAYGEDREQALDALVVDGAFEEAGHRHGGEVRIGGEVGGGRGIPRLFGQPG